jgi:riboflavin kinase/FMN adenylyltransferase
VGNFDGVHRGHAKIVERLLAHARRLAGPTIVFTFDPHPTLLLRPNLAPPPLTWIDRKAELLAELGVDALVAYATDEALLSLTPEDFFQQIVLDRLDARALVEGSNFRFGRQRSGDIALLQRLCEAHNVALEVAAPVEYEGHYVSSSRIRDRIAAGDVWTAGQMLTRPYRIRGMVTHGAARGARIGFPTANVDAIDTLLPAHGVYAGRACTAGTVWPAAIHIGPNPTFGERGIKVEVHLIGFEGSLYGTPMEVDFLHRLRDIQTFSNLEALQAQLRRDTQRAVEQAQHDSPRCG